MGKRLTDEERTARDAAKRVKIEAELATKKAAAQEKARNAPIFEGQFHVAGVSHEGRADIVEAEAREGSPVRLARDVGNRHDKNAVGAYLQSGSMIGFVPREDAKQYAQLLDAGKFCRAWIGAFWREDFGQIPIVRVEFYEPGSNLIAPSPEVFSPQRTRPTAPPDRSLTGWILAALAILGILIVATNSTPSRPASPVVESTHGQTRTAEKTNRAKTFTGQSRKASN